MSRYIAVPIDTKPFIVWVSTNLPAEGLVVEQVNVPAPVYGVCPLKIVDGELVERTAPEMATFETEYNIEQAMKANVQRLPSINAETFLYDGKQFPMDEVSRLFYTAMEKVGGNQKIMTIDNQLYNLLDASIPAFMAAFYSRLLNISKHDI